MLRRLRGILGTALTWGTAWAFVGLAWGTANWLTSSHAAVLARFSIAPATIILPSVVSFAVQGAISGAAFALVLIRAERHGRGIQALSMRRTLVWGAVGAAAALLGAPIVSGALDAVAPLLGIVMITAPTHGTFGPWALVSLGASGALGSASAAASLALARRQPTAEPQLQASTPYAAL